MVFIDEADVVVDPTLIEVDVGAYAVAAGPAGGVVDAVPRARLGHLVAPLVGTHLGDKPSRAAPFIDLLVGWSAAEAAGGEAVGSFVDGRLEALPLHPIVSNPIATDISSFRTQWHAATTERKVAYSERERVTAWLLNPFVQRPPPPGRAVTALADAAVFSEAADREMRVLGGETVSVVGFWRRAREGEEDTGFVLDEYVERLRALKPGDRVTVVRNGLEHPVGGTAGVVADAASSDEGKLRIQEEESGNVLELAPDRYPGFFVFPEDAPRTFSKAGIVRAIVSARLTGALEFILPTTSSEAARVALGDRGPRHGFGSRAEMYEAVSRAAREAGFTPPAFDTGLWAAFPALERGHGREATEDAAPTVVVAPTANVDHVAAAAAALQAASRARFTPMNARERVAALAAHAAEVERGTPGPEHRVSLLSLKYGPPPEGAVVDLGFLGVVGEGGGVWDPITGTVGTTLEKLRAARHAVLSAEVAEVFAPPEEGLADRHVQEHFTEDGGFGRDDPPPVGHSQEVVIITKTRPAFVDEGFGDAVAAPGDDEASPLDGAIITFLAKVTGDRQRQQPQRRAPRRIQGAHLIRTVVSYFAERQLRTRFQAPQGEEEPTSVAKLPGWFWLSPGLYAAMARAQDDADILRDLAVVLRVYVPAACKALISVGAVTQDGADSRELERRVDAVVAGELARSVERVKDAMLSMERVLRGIGTRDTAAVRQVGDFPDERYAPPHRGEPLEEGFDLLRPAAGGLNMVITADDVVTDGAVAAGAAMAPGAEVFGVPPPPPHEPARVFDAPVVPPGRAVALLPEAEGEDVRPVTPWAEELIRANPWLFDSPAPVRSPELLTWLDARVSELLPRSGLRRGQADRVMRAPQGAARHALSSVVLERLGPLLRTHRPQEPQLLRKELLARADPDTAVALLTFVLVAYMARAGGQGPLVDDLNDVLEARVDAATLNAQVLEDRFERMREDYRQENFGAMRAMDKADRAIFGELLVHRIVTVGDVREAAAVASEEGGGEGEEMVPVNREEYDDDQ